MFIHNSSEIFIQVCLYKGHDMTMFRLQREQENNNIIPPEINEIKQYSSARYVTANEAIWHLFGFNMSDQSPCVIRLDE